MAPFNPRSLLSAVRFGGSFWQSRRNQVLVGLLLLGILLGGGWVAFRALLPAPEEAELATNDPLEETDSTLTNPEEEIVEKIPVVLQERASAIEVEPLARCVNLDAAQSGWDTASGRRNLEILDPTMLRIDAASLAKYQVAGGDVALLIELQEERRLETLFYFELSEAGGDIPRQLRALQDFEEAGGGVNYLEMTTSFPELYVNQLNQFLPQIQAVFPDAELILRTQDVASASLRPYSFRAAGVEVAYLSGVSSYDDLNLEFPIATESVRDKARDVLENAASSRPVWVTSYRLDEDLTALPGPRYAPFENLQLGGTWGQALTTSFGYHELMLGGAEAICIHTLSGSPQNSLYYLDETVEASTYPALTDAGNYEFTPVGQAFYMLSKAMGAAGREDSREFKINNESTDVVLWIFADDAGARAWVVNAGAGQLALDMGKYGFDITGYETKSANMEQVVLSRKDVKTRVVAGLTNEAKILLDGYSLSILDLEPQTDSPVPNSDTVNPAGQPDEEESE